VVDRYNDSLILQIHNITEDEHFETTNFALTSTVLAVKKNIHKVKGYDVYRQNLIFSGEQLSDVQTLREVGVDADNCSFCLVVSLRTSVTEPPKTQEDVDSELEKKVLESIPHNPDPSDQTEASATEEENPLSFIASSLFQGIGAVSEGLKEVKKAAVQDLTDLKEGIKTLVSADIEESEEDKSILDLCDTLDGSLIETEQLLRSACEYRQFCIEMNHMEAELLSRLRNCNSHVILGNAASNLADRLQPKSKIWEEKRRLLSTLVIDPLQTIMETQLEPASHIRDVYRHHKKVFDNKNADYRDIQTQIAELRDGDGSAEAQPAEAVDNADIFGFFGAMANFVQTAGDSLHNLSELQAIETEVHAELSKAAKMYETSTKDFLKAMANLDVKISSHLKPCFQGYSKALTEVEVDILNGVFDPRDGELVEAEPAPSITSVTNSIESDTVLVQSASSKKLPTSISSPPADNLP